MGVVTLTFDRLTLKLICELYLSGETSVQIWARRPLDSRIVRYVRDGRTDGQTDRRTKATLIASFPSAPCDTSFKARHIEISLLTYLLTSLGARA